MERFKQIKWHLSILTVLIKRLINQLLNRRWKSYVYGILPHPTEPRSLLRSDNNGWFLPYGCVHQGVWSSDFAKIKKAIQRELGFSVNVLYYRSFWVEQSQRQIHGIYVLEHCGSIEKIQNGTWINSQTLDNLSLKFPEHKSVIKEYLTEIESGRIPELRPPWARPGWFDTAVAWIETQLLELDYKQLAPVECIKSSGISCILKVRTTSGNIYFKEASTLPLFCDEPIVTTELKHLFPDHLPTILSIDRKHHWMLSADFGNPIGRNAPLRLQKEIYRLFAQIQIQSVEQTNFLLIKGCLDRRLNHLQTQIEPLLRDEAALSELSTDEIHQLQTLAPYLKDLCSKLAGYHIPQTLVHGDLHLGNVALYEDNYIFFDWTDSCVSHPFFDMFDLFFHNKNQNQLLQELQNEYLTQWTHYESMERLIEAWTIAKPLCALHHAITYQHIVASLEARTKNEFSSALPNFLRHLLNCVER